MSELVDWSLAARIAELAAGESGELPDDDALREAVEASSGAVRSYTGLVPEQPVPAPEWVSRREWASINLDSVRESIAPLEERLGATGLPGPAGDALGGALGKVAGAQLGALVGYASRRVLGQFEFPLLGPPRPARLLFVAPNVAAAAASLDGPPETVLRWIALHEVTHAVHFSSAPWLRDHLGGLASSLLEGSRLGIGPSELAAAARSIVSTDPRRTLSQLWSSDPLTLLTPADSRHLLESTQATMAAVEGFAEHVMDAAAPALGENVFQLRAAMEERRDGRAPLARLLSWLLGLELKMRQYRDGKRFCDGVVELAGIEDLNRAWEGPETLPQLGELADPGAWLQRTGDQRLVLGAS